jgi:diacylglycerol kinase family enzyme
MPYLLIANPSSGSADDDLPARAGDALPDVRTLELTPDVDLASAIRRGLEEGRVIVACGGDGTVNAVAQHLAGTDGVMGVLPGGTLNHFARDLGVRDAETALSVLAGGAERRVDVGRAGDRVFVNNLGLGLYPTLVRERERREHRIGKWPALIVSMGRVMIDFEPLEGRIEADGDARRLHASAVFIGNNRISTQIGSLGERERLDGGVLDVRVLRTHSGLRGRATAAWRSLSPPRHVVRTDAREVEIRLDASAPIAIDGEQVKGSDHLTVRIDAASLRVRAPAPGRDERVDHEGR